MNSHIRQRVLAFMASRHVITLATVGADGLRISPAFYVLCDDFDFWFITHADSGFDPVTVAAGIVRSDAAEPEDVEVRVDGTIEPVHDSVEQAKAFSAFLMHAVDLSDCRGHDGQAFSVHRMSSRRIHFRAPSILRHTAVFHIAPAPRDPLPLRPRQRKFKAIRRNIAPSLPVERPTLSDAATAIPKRSNARPS